MTLTQRTMCRPLAQVWVVTGFRKLLDMLFSTADGRPYVGDSAYSASHPFTYLRHSHTYRDQPPTTGGCASGTDWAMSPMDKVLTGAGPTLAPHKDSFFTPCDVTVSATISPATQNGHEDQIDGRHRKNQPGRSAGTRTQGNRADVARTRAYFLAAAAVLL